MGGEASGGAAEASLGLNARSLRLGDLARHRKWVHLMGPVTLRLHTSVQAKIIQGLQLAKEGCRVCATVACGMWASGKVTFPP